jgi:hypothetical protein
MPSTSGSESTAHVSLLALPGSRTAATTPPATETPAPRSRLNAAEPVSQYT